jgi:hypothetical protein
MSGYRDRDSAGDADAPILAALRKAAREVAHVDPRWLALAEGKLALAEAEVLRGVASQTEEGRFLWALYWLWFGEPTTQQRGAEMSEGPGSRTGETNTKRSRAGLLAQSSLPP